MERPRRFRARSRRRPPGRPRRCAEGAGRGRGGRTPAIARRSKVSAVQLEARIATVRMAETFVISRGASDEAEVVYVELRHDGVSGFGEAAPIERYDESTESARAFAVEAGELLSGMDPFAFEEIEARLRERPGEQAAKAAIDAAVSYTHLRAHETPEHLV